MFRQSAVITFMMVFSIAAFAQTLPSTTTSVEKKTPRRRNEPRPYTLSIDNKTKIALDTAKTNAAFMATIQLLPSQMVTVQRGRSRCGSLILLVNLA